MDGREEYINQLKQEIQERNKQKQAKAYEDFMAHLAADQLEQEKLSSEQQIGSALNTYVEESHARGEIVNTFIKQYLDGKITIARWTLVLAMAATFLFKGQWIYWIVFIIVYKIYVTSERRKAFQEDVRRYSEK